MPTVEGRVATSRADRYLSQICEHLGHLQHGPSAGRGAHDPGAGHGPAPAVRRVERTGDHALVEFDWGRCDLTADPTELVLHLHADDPQDLAQGQRLLTHRVETIGRRDKLSLVWGTSETTERIAPLD
ncbi:DUF2218 domain-containing protein [Nocardioides caricicola]|uniref:DUF2218 domain-containing protein n=1 Tax=Nocardioides caricicola TaxID=634770 RepID=A0ABW0N202_9ACTN